MIAQSPREREMYETRLKFELAQVWRPWDRQPHPGRDSEVRQSAPKRTNLAPSGLRSVLWTTTQG